MNKLKTFFKNLIHELKKIAVKHIDKVAHIAITYSVVYTLAHHTNIAIAVGVGIIIGTSKELIDKWLGGKISIGDLIADVIGIALAYTIFLL